eukprot:GHVQ01043105.1.p1 GENE.GHVQ01043105.1~~GHVQ01043105.1.p1  ORF type:complete len:197 (+),score=22.87 GHVQ01043105.1:689-1279(+)
MIPPSISSSSSRSSKTYIKKLCEHLWNNYTQTSPEAARIYNLFFTHIYGTPTTSSRCCALSEASRVSPPALLNDHIAFRTVSDPRVKVDELSKHFKHLGYVEKNSYNFPVKKLFAKHFEYEPENVLSTGQTPDKDFEPPRIFISELQLDEFSVELQTKMRQCVDSFVASKSATLSDTETATDATNLQVGCDRRNLR